MSLNSVEQTTLDKYRKEILDYHKQIFDFNNNGDFIDILTKLSSFSARASWIRHLIIKSMLPEYKRFRIDELDPFFIEVDRQFKIWSRISAITKDEYDMSRGQ